MLAVLQQSIKRKHKSDINYGTASSLSTIFAVVNSMIGTVILVLPVQFMQYGFFLNIIILLFVAFITWYTSNLLLSNMKDGEENLSDLLERKLGNSWRDLYSMISVIQLVSLNIIFFVIITQIVYKLSIYFFALAGKEISGINEFSLNQFSLQWACIILFCLLAPTFFIKKIDLILELSKYGVYAILGFILMVIYVFIRNLDDIVQEDNFKNINVMFKGDISTTISLIGNFSLAFHTHNLINSLMSNKSERKTSVRDNKISFLIVVIIYLLTGICGGLAISGMKSEGSLITHYLGGERIGVVMQLVFLFNLLATFPLFNFFAKSQLFNLLNEKYSYQPSGSIRNLYNISNCFIGFLVAFFNVNPGLLISLCGSVACFFTIYIFPVKIELQKQHSKIDKELSLLTQITEQGVECTKPKQTSKQIIRRVFLITLPVFGAVMLVSQLAGLII